MSDRRFADLGGSRRRGTAEGVERVFPTFDDYLAWLVAAGEVADARELAARPDLIAEIFHHWTRTGQLACQFAVDLARRPELTKWLHVVVAQPRHDDIADYLEPVLVASSADQAEAALLSLPGVDSLEELAGFAGRLCRHPRWYWERIEPSEELPDDDPDHVCVGLRWRSPEGPPSWVLAFGDFPALPFTRRAPVPALVLRTRGEMNPKHGNYDLARMDFRSVSQGDEGPATARAKQELLNGEHLQGARARVTLRLPIQLLPLLGPEH